MVEYYSTMSANYLLCNKEDTMTEQLEKKHFINYMGEYYCHTRINFFLNKKYWWKVVYIQPSQIMRRTHPFALIHSKVIQQ